MIRAAIFFGLCAGAFLLFLSAWRHWRVSFLRGAAVLLTGPGLLLGLSLSGAALSLNLFSLAFSAGYGIPGVILIVFYTNSL